MRRQLRRALLSAAVLMWIVVQPGQATAATPATGTTPTYKVTVLPTLGAAFDANNAAGINDKGWIVGDANARGSTRIANATEHATVWWHGVITDLGTLGGPNSSIGFVARPNNTGLISGNAQTNAVDPFAEGWGLNLGCDAVGDPCAASQYEVRGFVWRDGERHALPTLGGNNALAFGGANDLGQVVGTAENAVPDPGCAPPQVFDWKAVIWGPRYDQIQELPLYPGDTVGGTTAINDRGQIVGASGACGPPAPTALQHALLWHGGAAIDLGTHARALGGEFNNVPTAINNLGQVVGWSDLPGDTVPAEAITHAFLWQHGVITDLGTLPRDVFSFAYAINDSGQVVGQSCDQGFNCRAFLWQNGTMSDLNDLIGADGSFALINAEGINTAGEVVGFGVYPSAGQGRGWVAVPCNALSPTDAGCRGGATTAPSTRRVQYARRVNARDTPHSWLADRSFAIRPDDR